jgi:hypothetical protein
MGGSSYDSKAYSGAVHALRSSGTTFARSSTASATGIRNIAEILDPRKLNKGIRESCFAPGFNDATPVVIGIDGTGSMSRVPHVIQEKLPELIEMMVEQGISDHPNLMFMCFDDETVTKPDACFQMSQFEIDAAKLIESLNEMIIPGAGGGNAGESYHITFYALAHHTRIESFERDGQKGFFFLICDEQPYFDSGDPGVRGMTPALAKEIFGDTIQHEIPMLQSVRDAAEKYHIFVLRPHHTSHGKDQRIGAQWRDLLDKAGVNPQNVIDVEETDALITVMTTLMARINGVDEDEIIDVLKVKGAHGIDAAISATSAIQPYTGAVAVGTVAGNLDLNEKGRDRE